MTRLNASLAVAAAALLAATPALAADWPHMSSDANFFGNTDDMRSGFSPDYDNSNAYDPLTFELGLRYWYSMGSQSFGVGSNTLSESDKTQSVEAHFRVDDHSTNFYAKGLAGTAFNIDGSGTNTSLGTTPDVTDGKVAYAGGDIGYSWLNGPKNAPTFGPFAGYMYWNDSPNIGRANFTTGTQSSDFSVGGSGIIGPGNSVEDDLNISALRLGFSGKAQLSNYFDISGEVAAVPYAKIGGTLGAFGVPLSDDGTNTTLQSSAATIDGWGYGAMAEIMAGFHPTNNLTFRVGGRAWYLQGRADTTFNTITVKDSDATVVGSQYYISTSNPWSLFRYGALAEMTYSF